MVLVIHRRGLLTNSNNSPCQTFSFIRSVASKTTSIMVNYLVLLLFVAFANADPSPASKSHLPTSRYHTYYPTASGRPKDDTYRYSDYTKYYAGKYPSADSTSAREAWSPSSPWNGTYSRYQTQYVRPSYYPDPVEGSYSMYQYQQIRTPVAYKKPTPYHSKFVKAPEKPKPKKPQIAYYPVGYKKTNYPRVHTPYTMHKYPTKKTVHPYYRRYYQMYAMPSIDMLRNKVKNIYAESESSTATSVATTEDRNDYSAPSDDYTNYNDTSSNGYSAYYDNYEEQTTSEPTAVSYDETSTRGYYGDRIYMSSHGVSDNGFRHRLYLVRNEPEDDDDDETIFD